MCLAPGTTMLTLVDGLGHGNSYPHAVGCLRAVRGGQVLTVGQFEAFEDNGVGAGDDVLGLTKVVLQDLTLVLTQVPRFVYPRAAVTCREGEVAEGGDGKLGATI